MIANAGFHRWRNAQRLMNPAKIVMHVMKRNRVLQILKFLAECIGQARKSTHRHSHGQILALNVARGNVFVCGRAINHGLACAHTNGGTVSRLGRLSCDFDWALPYLDKPQPSVKVRGPMPEKIVFA